MFIRKKTLESIKRDFYSRGARDSRELLAKLLIPSLKEICKNTWDKDRVATLIKFLENRNDKD